MLPTYFLYSFIFIIVAFFGYIAQYCNDYSARVLARFCCFFTLIIPAALRYEIGADYWPYISLYKNFMIKHSNAVIEPGFRLIGFLCHKLQLSPQMFLAVIAGLTYAPVCFYIPRKHFFTIMTFYVIASCYLNSYDMSRQLLATSILFCSFFLYYNNKKIKAIILIAIASSIHYSSITALPILLISEIRINNYIRLGLLIALGFILVNNVTYPFIVNIAEFVSPRYGRYLSFIERTKINTGLSLLIYSLPSMLTLLNSKNIIRQNKGNFILTANAFFILIMIMVFTFSAFGRMHLVLIFIPLFSLQILYDTCKKYAKLYHCLLMLCFIALFMRYIGSNSYSMGFMIAPYNSILGM